MISLHHKGRITGRTVNKIRRQRTVLLFLTALIGICNSRVIAKPLKVYILASQSNMVGAAKIAKRILMLIERKGGQRIEDTLKPDGMSCAENHQKWPIV